MTARDLLKVMKQAKALGAKSITAEGFSVEFFREGPAPAVKTARRVKPATQPLPVSFPILGEGMPSDEEMLFQATEDWSKRDLGQSPPKEGTA